MAGETILVIDADQDLDLRIATALEEVGYTVFATPSGVVNAEILQKLRPSLIYLKPLALSPSGFESCKAIHSFPLLRNVPIVILASLKEPLDHHYFNYYGILDSLKPTFSTDELIKKTETTLSLTRPSRLRREHESISEESANYPKADCYATAEESRQVTEGESIVTKVSQKRVPTGLRKQQKKDESEEHRMSTKKLLSSLIFWGMEKKRHPLLLLVISSAILLVISGGGFLVYQQFTSTRKVSFPSVVSVPSSSPSKSPRARLEPQLPHGRMTANASTSLTSSAQPAQESSIPSESASQPPHKPLYSVQLGAFKNERNAQAFTNKFREKGYDAFTQSGVTGDRSTIYRVLVSKHETRKAAERLSEEIQLKEKMKTTLYEE